VAKYLYIFLGDDIMSNINVGDKAPDFKLTSSKENMVSLEDFKGKKVILSFYPVAFTPV
jgi:glutaredoxin-dependent peroxiredoxin